MSKIFSSGQTQELDFIPDFFLSSVPVKKGASEFILKNFTDDFRDKIVRHIGQTSNNISVILTNHEVSRCMNGIPCITLTERGGGETPFGHLDTMYLYASNAQEQMEQFASGYKNLVQDTINRYRLQLPIDILSDVRIAETIGNLQKIASEKYLNNPYEYFHKQYHPTPEKQTWYNKIMHMVRLGR